MSRALAIVSAWFVAAASTGPCLAQAERQGAATAAVAVREFVTAHCTACHAGADAEAGLDLAVLANAPWSAWRDDAFDWADVRDAVDAHRMPPSDAEGPAPTVAARAGFVTALDAVLRHRRPGEARDPGRPVLQRLNRARWRNTVRDLLGVDVDAADDFPEDPSGYGFDHVGDVLFVTPMLVERYWDATVAAVDAFLAQPELVERFADARPTDGADPERVARRAVERLLRRAFRRPPSEREIADRVALVVRALERGAGFERGLRQALLATLLSPSFLFLVERDDPTLVPGAVRALDDHELATRLAYFVWSSMPDAALFARADRGELRDPDVLVAELDRMLADPRARALADDFAAQWLGFRSIRDLAVDVRRFRGFHGGLRHAMYEEAALSFLTVVREDRAWHELIDSDRTWVNATLAKHYGLDGVAGDAMREVELPAGDPRGGVLGQAAILTATSFPLRTSPVVRGKWILENLLGTPPPPPPADAGTLPPDDKNDAGLTLRQQLERHRRDPRCASCHAQMDALGLALERFDGIGRLRSEAHGLPIDDAVELPDGTRIAGADGLVAWLGGQRDRVLRTLAEKLFVYALGRPLEPADAEAVDRAVLAVDAADGRMRALFRAVVTSVPFRFRRVGASGYPEHR